MCPHLKERSDVHAEVSKTETGWKGLPVFWASRWVSKDSLTRRPGRCINLSRCRQR